METTVRSPRRTSVTHSPPGTARGTEDEAAPPEVDRSPIVQSADLLWVRRVAAETLRNRVAESHIREGAPGWSPSKGELALIVQLQIPNLHNASPRQDQFHVALWLVAGAHTG